MKIECLSEEEHYLLCDGEAAENRAGAMRSHIAQCSVCRAEWDSLQTLAGDLRAPIADVDVDASVAQVMARIAANEVPPHAPRSRRMLYVSVGAIAIAAAAAVPIVLFPRVFLRDVVTNDYTARGSVSSSLQRDVGIEMFTVDSKATPLTRGATVDQGATFVAGYRNLHRGSPVFALIFAVDSHNDVHWLYPAYEHPGEDPASFLLEPRDTETLMATSVVLDVPSVGAMRIVAIVTTAPLRVSAIEALHGEELEPAALRAKFSEAEIEAQIEEWIVNVRSSNTKGTP